MPPLRFFGRRWFIAGDEVGMLALTSSVVEAVLAAAYLDAPFLPAISGRGDRGPLVLCGDLHLAAMAVDLVLAAVSSMGAAYEESKRNKALSISLFIRILLEVPKGVALVWLLIKGHMVMFCQDYKQVWKKEDVTTWTFTILLALSILQLAEISARLGLIFLIGPRCPPVRDASEKPLLLAPSSKFFKLLAFFGNASDKEYLVQTLLVQFMEGFDWTVGDAMQGTILLNASQDLMKLEQKPKSLKILGMNSMPDWGVAEDRHIGCSCGGVMPAATKAATLSELEDANYFLGLALSSYGAVLLAALPNADWSHRQSATCQKLCSYFRDLESRESSEIDLRISQAYLTGLPDHEDCTVVMNTVEDGVGKPRFCVIVDPRKKLVIVSVRGTSSLSDAFTDMCATCEEIPQSVATGPGKGPHYVHKAMWEAAIYVENTLKHSGILESLKVLEQWKETSPTLGNAEYSQAKLPIIKDNLPDCTGYQLAITGHSLGGGVATYVKARMSVHVPEVRCVGYGAPPLFSPDMEKFHSKNMYYVVMGDDVIARLGLRNMEFMRDRMVMLMSRCPFSKMNIFLSGALLAVFGSHRIFRQLHQFPGDPTAEAILMMGRIEPRTAQLPTFHAGPQLWLRAKKLPGKSCLEACLPKIEYRGFWTDSEGVQEILIRPDSLRQHMPDYYTDGLSGSIEFCRQSERMSGASESDPLV